MVSLKDHSQVQITDGQKRMDDPAWSPDGEWILFLQSDERDIKQLYIMSADGQMKRQLTHASNIFSMPQSPVWAPNGSEIAYFKLNTLVIVDTIGTVIKSMSIPPPSSHSLRYLYHEPDMLLFLFQGEEVTTSNLYKLSLSKQTAIIWKTKRPLLEVFHDISRDGTQLVFCRPEG